MANHKRKRPKHQRGGCLCCKPWKDERVKQREPLADQIGHDAFPERIVLDEASFDALTKMLENPPPPTAELRALFHDPRPAGKRRKNRRRWCKGRVGVEHTPVWRDMRATKSHLVYICTTCGKQLDYLWSFGWEFSGARGAARRARFVEVCQANDFPIEFSRARAG